MSHEVIEKFVLEFLQQSVKRDLKVEPHFVRYYITLLSLDYRASKDMYNPSKCRQRYAIENLFSRYSDPFDATICNIKMTYEFDNFNQLNLNVVKQKHEEDSRAQMQILIDRILHYPETSNTQQLQEMSEKMAVFIISRYGFGDPRDAVLRKHTIQSMDSVIAKGELQKYVLKRKLHRLEYLQRLVATVAGILIYNNFVPDGLKENMRNIWADLEMAQNNTEENFDVAIKHSELNATKAHNAIEAILKINAREKFVNFHWPLEKAHELNAFTAFFSVHKRLLEKLFRTYEKTKELIAADLKRMKCVIEKISEILKFRTAIESELIFPHFVYLGDLWLKLDLYFFHLVEINKIKDKMDGYLSSELVARFEEKIAYATKQAQENKKPKKFTFSELIDNLQEKKIKGNILKVQKNFEDYCSFTMILTGGLLRPSKFKKKLCINFETRFGFNDIELAKLAELRFDDFMQNLTNSVHNSVDLLLLFELHGMALKEIAEKTAANLKQGINIGTQTEMVVTNNLLPSNWINVTWNIWDYHRETMHLWHISKCQTKSEQTNISYGKRNAQNQAYNARRHI